MRSTLLIALAIAGLQTLGAEAQDATTTTIAPSSTTAALPPFATSMPLDELLGNGTVHTGDEEEWDFGGDEIPIVQSSRTTPMTPPDLKNVTIIASGYQEAFTLYKSVYNRDYKTDLEEQKRYRYFLRNMAGAFYNQTKNPMALFGANNFSDFSLSEFLPYHNLTDAYTLWANRSTDRGTKAPSATGEDGFDILQNPFDQDFALYDVNGSFVSLGKGKNFWHTPPTTTPTGAPIAVGAARGMAGASVSADDNRSRRGNDPASNKNKRRMPSKSLSGVATDTASTAKTIIQGVKSLKELLTGQEPNAAEDERWERIEQAYEDAKDALVEWGDALWANRRDQDKQAAKISVKERSTEALKKKRDEQEESLLNAAETFTELESKYVSLKRVRTQSKAIHAEHVEGSGAAPQKRSFDAMAEMPQSFDWRNYGVVSPVRDQASCGGCWAFAAAGNIEGVWRVAGRSFTELSEQSLISCDTYSGNMGCKGGVMQYAFNFIIKYQAGYLSRLDVYPFSSGTSGTSGLCEKVEQVPGAAINRYVSISKDETVMAQYVANLGPVAVAIDSTSWQSYTGGIITDCISLSVDHAVLIVGYDNANDPPYWIIKNSWGTGWGEEGYIRIAKGSNQCIITRNPTTALAAAATTLPARIYADAGTLSTSAAPPTTPTTTVPKTTTTQTSTTQSAGTTQPPASTTLATPVPEATTRPNLQEGSSSKPSSTTRSTNHVTFAIAVGLALVHAGFALFA